jgi:hypothetical protein
MIEACARTGRGAGQVEEMKKKGQTFLQFPTLVLSRSGSMGIFSGRIATPAKKTVRPHS